MELQLTDLQFRRLLDLAYVGNWVLNSTRGEHRWADYDQLEQTLFDTARRRGMTAVATLHQGQTHPSQAFVQGGIHHAIAQYENDIFYDILAQDLALRDLNEEEVTFANYSDFMARMEYYLEEFQEYGTDNLVLVE